MKSILIFTRHYPPAVSGGAKRPFLLAGALRQAGLDVRVCAPCLPPDEDGWAVPHPNRDPPTLPASNDFSWRELARDWLLWPDPDIRWCLRAANAVLSSRWRPDWIISTSPPESIHVAGARLARRTGARWAADFRDLWLEAPHRSQRLRFHRRYGERWLAHRLLPKADLVLAVDPVVAAEVTGLGAKGVRVLPHFVADARPKPGGLPPASINILHAGSIALSDPDADIGEILRPFEAAVAKNPELRLHLVGRLTDGERTSVAHSPATRAIDVHGVKSLEEAASMMAAADALVFVASSKMHVPPSKIADYLTFDAPLIPCGTGPWRADPRVPAVNTEEFMAQLKRGQPRNVDVAPPTASEAARRLLGWMEGAAGARRS